MTAGHLFVVHGKIDALSHDAAIVPVDHALDFTPAWSGLLGGPPWPTKPATWDDGWGRVAATSNWLVEVGDGDYSSVLSRLRLIVDDVVMQNLAPRGGRATPLVALPVLGVGRGGHAHEPGTVVRELVATLSELAAASGLDVALVSPDPSVYAAAQFARRELPSGLTPKAQDLADDLGKRAREGELALFLGAGVSIPAGLPSWNDLIHGLAEGLPGVAAEDLDGLSATDQAELIERADPKGFQEKVANQARRETAPSLLHGLLAGLDVDHVVTTNYDLLYEKAVEAAGRGIESVMPWASALGAERWILKLHGDVNHVESIVLTRRHMVRFDAANRPSAALLQSLLLTRHLLFVGASLTDDNVIRLAHEVEAYREYHQKGAERRAFGTVLDASPHGEHARARLWHRQLEWAHLTEVGEDLPWRTLELFLDRLALAASSNASWLLDERFVGLLSSEQDRHIAENARRLAKDIERAADPTWSPLRDALSRLGS